MPLKIKMKDCLVEDCGVGFSVSQGSDVDIELETTDFINCGKVLEERDIPNLFSALNFQPNTPPEKVLALLAQIANDPSVSRKDIEANMTTMGLKDYVGVGADLSTISQTLIDLHTNGRLETILNSMIQLFG